MKITMQFLAQHMACHPAREQFRKLWPDGRELTRENLLLAAEQRFDLHWLAQRILKPEALRVYEAGRAAAERVYNAAAAEAGRVYNAAAAEAGRVYNAAAAEAAAAAAAEAAAWRVYQAAAAEAGRVYDAARAEALWNAWKQQEGEK